DLTDMGRQELSPSNPKLWELPDIVEEIAAIEAGDFEVIELKDGTEILLNGTKEQREAVRTPEGGFVLHRHDGTLNIAPDQVAAVKSGADLDKQGRERFKDVLRSENGVQTEKLHNITQMLKAYSLYERDVEYVVQDNKVVIVDEFTGRLMSGR